MAINTHYINSIKKPRQCINCGKEIPVGSAVVEVRDNLPPFPKAAICPACRVTCHGLLTWIFGRMPPDMQKELRKW